MPTTPSILNIFSIASAEKPPQNLAIHSQQDGPHTITVETPCTGQSRQISQFIRDAMEFAGTTGAQHAGRGLIALAQKEDRYLSIRVDCALH